MALEVLWVHDCPGHIETELVAGVIQVTCYVEGTPEPAPTRVTNGLRVLYTFKEQSGATIRDRSGVGEALDLEVESPGAVTWQPGGGLSVDSPTLIASAAPAAKVISAVSASKEVTIDAWVKPASLTQDGPARMITISADFHHCNIGLAQAAEAYDVRLRTTETTDNGRPSLAAPSGAVTMALTHVAYTRTSSGTARLYTNGTEIATQAVGGDLSNWEAAYRLALGNELVGGRPWLGEFHLVAIYGRALSSNEVSQNFRAGVSPGS